MKWSAHMTGPDRARSLDRVRIARVNLQPLLTGLDCAAHFAADPWSTATGVNLVAGSTVPETTFSVVGPSARSSRVAAGSSRTSRLAPAYFQQRYDLACIRPV